MPWHVQNQWGYLRTSWEAQDNAWLIYSILYSMGWKLPAVCAMLGNCESESGYNPWRWQSEVVLDVGDPRIGYIGGPPTGHAYGLCQQDPAAKYIDRAYAQALPSYGPNYANQAGNQNDGTAQLQYLHWICSQNSAGGEWLEYNGAYAMTFQDFITDTTHSVDYLTHTFFYCYERAQEFDEGRVTAAMYWWSFFGGDDPDPPEPPEPPEPPPTPPGTGHRSIPVWLFVKLLDSRNKQQNGKKLLPTRQYRKW